MSAIWRHGGLLISIVYLLASCTILILLIYDAGHVNISALRQLLPAIMNVALNSLLVTIPAAALSLTAAYPLARCFRATPPLSTIIPILIIFTPFLSSSIALYQGIKALSGIGPIGFVFCLAFRYFPICVAFLLLGLAAVPQMSKATLENLRVVNVQVFLHLELPLMMRNIAVLFVYLCFAMSLDVFASTIVGGGRIQTFGNLIFDYSHTHSLQPISSAVSALVAAVLILMLVFLIGSGPQRLGISFDRTPSRRAANRLTWSAYRNLPFCSYLIAYSVILYFLFNRPAPVNEQFNELLRGLFTSIFIVGATAAVTMVGSLLIGAFFHLEGIKADSAKGKLITLVLFIPLLLPAVLAGRMAEIVQGTLGYYGNELSISLWYAYFFGPLCVLVILGHPIAFHSALPRGAVNLRVPLSDYMNIVFIPVVLSAVMVGGGLFVAVAISDSLIARYIGGTTKTLGVILANHQEGALSEADFQFMAALSVTMLVALFLAGLMLFIVQKRIWTADSAHSFQFDTDAQEEAV
jgi:ABC-type spermidine/putrescine transport system permease subunit II